MNNNWIKTAERLPDMDECVLVLVSAQRKNITLHYACQIAWWTEFGWIVEGYEDVIDPNVSYWAPIPDFPEEVKMKFKEVERKLNDLGRGEL